MCMATQKIPVLPISLIEDTLTVYRFEADELIPSCIWQAKFVTVSKSSAEISIVLSDDMRLETGLQSPNWKAFYIDQQLAHDELGILAHISSTLAEAECSIFALSTYDTDYILVPTGKLDQALAALVDTGKYIVMTSPES